MPKITVLFRGGGVANYGGGVEPADHQLWGGVSNLPITNSGGGCRDGTSKNRNFLGRRRRPRKISAYKMDMYGLVLILAIRKCNKNEPQMKGRRDRYILGNGPKILGGVSNRPITNSGGVSNLRKPNSGGGVEHRYFGHLSDFV